MRVAYVSTYPPTPCGIAEYTTDLIKSIKNLANLDVLVLADGVTNHDLSYKEVAIVSAFFPGKPSYGRLLKVARDYGPFDILHIQHEYGLFPPRSEFLNVLKELRRYCDALVVTLHTVYHAVRGYKLVKHQKMLGELVDAIIVHSALMEYELWNQGVSLSKIHLIPHGTPLNDLAVSKEAALRELGLSELSDKFIFATVGFIRRDKGLDTLLEAFQKVRSKHSNAVLIIAGVPQDKEGIEHARELGKLAKELPALDGGNVIEVRKYLTRRELTLLIKASDLIVLPYRDDLGVFGVSGMLHVVMGCFKPVICSRTPRLVECSALIPEVTVTPNDAGELAEKMIYAIENYSEFLELCRPLFDLAVRSSWRNVARKHLMLYEKVLSSK